MIKKTLDFPETTMEHIESFRRHLGIKSDAEAIRTLIHGGFIYYGNPLNESPKILVGKPSHKKPYEKSEAFLEQKEETNDRYEELMKQLNLIKDEDSE